MRSVGEIARNAPEHAAKSRMVRNRSALGPRFSASVLRCLSRLVRFRGISAKRRRFQLPWIVARYAGNVRAGSLRLNDQIRCCGSFLFFAGGPILNVAAAAVNFHCFGEFCFDLKRHFVCKAPAAATHTTGGTVGVQNFPEPVSSRQTRGALMGIVPPSPAETHSVE